MRAFFIVVLINVPLTAHGLLLERFDCLIARVVRVFGLSWLRLAVNELEELEDVLI